MHHKYGTQIFKLQHYTIIIVILEELITYKFAISKQMTVIYQVTVI
jgi:hypothetical protein